MKVTATRSVYVTTDKGEELLSKNQSCEVDGRKYNDDHMFIKAGYLIAEQDEKPKRGRKQKDEPTPDESQDSGTDSED